MLNLMAKFEQVVSTYRRFSWFTRIIFAAKWPLIFSRTVSFEPSVLRVMQRTLSFMAPNMAWISELFFSARLLESSSSAAASSLISSASLIFL